MKYLLLLTIIAVSLYITFMSEKMWFSFQQGMYDGQKSWNGNN